MVETRSKADGPAEGARHWVARCGRQLSAAPARFSYVIPNEHDIKAGYTEVLTAVAVNHPERPHAEIPWAHEGEVDPWPGDVDVMLREIGWDYADLDYVVYLVPKNEYRPLAELGIRGPKERGRQNFAATPDEVARVRAVMSGQHAAKVTRQSNGLPG
jgi:hypothetical protein